MPDRVTLQSTTVPEVTSRPVSFESAGDTLRGRLFLPKEPRAALPGVVVTGAWTTVKEQMAGTYARELATRGLAALAFDFAGWGESAGVPRFVEDPARKTADISAAAAFVASIAAVDRAQVHGLGICASAGYMLRAVADGDNLARLALVAPWLHDPELAQSIYGGEEPVAELIATSRGAAAASTPQLITAASTTESSALMYQAPYYTEADRGLIEAYDNTFNLASWEPWLTYNALEPAERLAAPTLVVGSDAMALPAGSNAFMARTEAPVTRLWLDDVSQFDFYDRADVVGAVADAVAAHLKN